MKMKHSLYRQHVTLQHDTHLFLVSGFGYPHLVTCPSGFGWSIFPLIWLFHIVIMTFSPMLSQLLPHSGVMSPICSNRNPICSYLPIHCLSHCYSREDYSTLFLISCQWWGIHHFPPSMGHFLSNSTHYPGRWPSNSLQYLRVGMP